LASIKQFKQFKQLEQLRGWRQLVFVAALAERTQPNLTFFANLLEVPLLILPARLLDAVWHSIESREALQVMPQIQTLESLDDALAAREEYGAQPARDAIQQLLNILELLARPEKSMARAAAEASFQTVTTFVEFSEGEGLEEHDLVMLLDRHPLVKAELNFYRQLSDLLKAAPIPSVVFLKEVRRLAAQEGVSNIGISLEDGA